MKIKRTYLRSLIKFSMNFGRLSEPRPRLAPGKVTEMGCWADFLFKVSFIC